MSAIAWVAIKTALHAWFVAATGLPAERVVFRGQNIARPSGTEAWVSLKWRTTTPIGRGATKYVNNPTPTAGAELLRKTVGNHRVMFEATCYPPAPPSDGSSVPDASEAHALLHEVVISADSLNRRDALNVAGIGLLKFEPIVALDGVINTTQFEARAILAFSFMVPSEIAETCTTIETVNLEMDTVDPVKVFTFSVNLGT